MTSLFSVNGVEPVEFPQPAPPRGSSHDFDDESDFPSRNLGPIRRWIHANPRKFDGIVTALFAAFYLFAFMSSEIVDLSGMDQETSSWERRAPMWLDVFISTITIFGIALRRTHTQIAFLIILTTSIISFWPFGIDPIALTIGVYALATYRPRRESWAGFALVIALVLAWVAIEFAEASYELVGVSVISPSNGAAAFMVLATTLTPIIVALSGGRAVRSQRSYEQALLDRAQALTSERDQQAASAALNERNRIAREMHDVVAHSLTVMIALADGASAALPKSPEKAKTAVDALSETGRTALVETRRVLGVLRIDDEVPLSPQPDGRAVDELIEQFRAAGLSISLVRSGVPLPHDPTLQLTIFRIVQESLTNTMRYAGPRAVAEVTIASEIGHTAVTVVDNGPTSGIAHSVGTGNGLVGMRERVAVFGGTVDIGPRTNTDHGWKVSAEIPWDH